MFYEAFHETVSRRSFFGAVSGAAIFAAVTPAVAKTAGNVRPLDIHDPRENLYGFAKMWGTIGDKAVFALSGDHLLLFDSGGSRVPAGKTR